MAMSDMSPADIVALTDGGYNRGGGFGNNGDGWWIILLFILLGGFGNNRGFGNGYGAGNVGGNEVYPWINQVEQMNSGFRDQMINGTINGIQQGVNSLATQLCNCCGDMQMSLANGFAGVNAALCNGFNGIEQGANARQIANMQQAFNAQMATMQGFNAMQAQLADCCCENRLATANQTATILAENCADRAALSDGVRDIMQANTANTQAILDKLCALELDTVKNQLAQAQRDNVGLQNQLNMAVMRESQTAQTAAIIQGQNAEIDALYNRLNNCPVPSMPVYGRTPIFSCNGQNSCGCGCN